jgi:antiviral helicase SKI2
MDMSRVKDLQLRDLIAKRLEEMKTAQEVECLKCPQFVKHVSSHPNSMSKSA